MDSAGKFTGFRNILDPLGKKEKDREIHFPDPFYIPDARSPGPDAGGLRPLVPESDRVAPRFLHRCLLFLE